MTQFDLFEEPDVFYATSIAINRDFGRGMVLVNHMRANKYKALWILQNAPNQPGNVIRVFTFEDKGDNWGWLARPDVPTRFYKHLTWYS